MGRHCTECNDYFCHVHNPNIIVEDHDDHYITNLEVNVDLWESRRETTLWATLPPESKRVLVDSEIRLDLAALLDFLRYYNDARKWRPHNSWRLACYYLQMGYERARDNMLLNGAVLQYGYDDVVKHVNLIGSLDEEGLNDPKEFLRRVAEPFHYLKCVYDLFGMTNEEGKVHHMATFLTERLKSDADCQCEFCVKKGGILDRQREIEDSRRALGIVEDNRVVMPTRDAPTLGTQQNRAAVQINITFFEVKDKTTYSLKIGKNTKMKKLFTDYAWQRKVSLRSLRFYHEGRYLFLSNVGHVLPSDLGIFDSSQIVVAHAETEEKGLANSQNDHPRTNPTKRKKKKRNKTKQSPTKKVQPFKQPLAVDETEKEWKAKHFMALNKLHEEMRPRLKVIRQRLNNLGLERTAPKAKSSPRRAKSTTAPVVNNPPSEGTGGKAGKTRFFVQVGEVSNLYKTSKSRPSNRQRHLSIDLHGLTRSDALEALNDSLPLWYDYAMSGSYPFIIPVEIICGAGNQILSEVVENWIREHAQVANAPKFSR